MINCCIFDLDGTLLYTLGTITHYINLTLEKYGIEPICEDECRRFIGDGARLLIKRSLASKGIRDESLSKRILADYNFAYNQNTTYLTEPYEGIREMIEALRARGVKLGVLSNKPMKTTEIVVNELFGKSFDFVMGASDGTALKPAPDGLNIAMERLGVTPDTVMYIGDTGVDIKTGRAAGAALTVGVSWGYRSKSSLTRCGAHIIVNSPLDIVKEVDLRA